MHTRRVAIALAFGGLMLNACQTVAQQASQRDALGIIAAVVESYRAQAAGLPDKPVLTLPMISLRAAAAKLGAAPADTDIAAALAVDVVMIERLQTVTTADNERLLVGNPFIIRIQSLQRTSNSTASATVEIAYNVKNDRRAFLSVGTFRVDLRRERSGWMVVSKTLIAQS